MRELVILEEIERDPDTTQANLAYRIGVAVGTVNWHLKRMVAKGYVKVKRLRRKKLRYIITPKGIARRARLTVAYIDNTMRLYREVRRQARNVLQQVKSRGHDRVRISGDGDIADVCRLTCIEQGVKVVEEGQQDGLCTLVVQGREIKLKSPEAERTQAARLAVSERETGSGN